MTFASGFTFEISAIGPNADAINERLRMGKPVHFWTPTPPPPPKRRTSAADRTRSARWRAGARRTRKVSARRPCPAPADRFSQFQDLGWMTDGTEYPPPTT